MRNHFGVNRLRVAGALASLADPGWLAHVVAEVAAAKAGIAAIAAASGLAALPSATNFVAIDCGRDGAFARRVLDGLVARGIFVRKPAWRPRTAASGSAPAARPTSPPSRPPCRRRWRPRGKAC